MTSGSPVLGNNVLGPRRLLIVGDVALGRALIEMVLSRLGYTVTCVVSGREALSALDHTRFTMALIAVCLPDSGGLELARRLRATPGPVGAMPIVLFGRGADEGDLKARCREARLDGYLPTPLSIGRLVSSVCGIVRGTTEAGSEFMTVSRSEPLALDRLREFTDGDGQLERELVSLFLSTATLYLDELRGRLERPTEWRDTAHALKGASANIGARTLQRLAAEAERAGPAADRLAGLEDATEDVRRLFRERWAGEPPVSEIALARSS